MKPVQVIGLGLGPQDITPRLARVIAEAEVLAGGRRLLDMLPEQQGTRLELSGGLAAWLDQVEAAARDQVVVVLASGDPGFFGVARAVIERLGAERVEVWPNLSAMQAACARLKLPWSHAAHVSLHAPGEDGLARLWRAMSQADLVSVYTSPAWGPPQLAALLQERGLDNWRLHVLEDLGAPRERVAAYSLDRAAQSAFAPLNMVLLRRTGSARAPRLGLAEAAYAHEDGLITKAEVRAVALAKLELGPEMTLWDVGAGSGSLGLEASLLLPGGRVIAVEQKAERVAMIAANRRAHGVGMLEIARGAAPGALRGLPAPHRVFIGGGGKYLAAIIRAAAHGLRPKGIILVSAVLLDSVETARRALAQAGLAVDETLVQVSRGEPVAGQSMLRALNPVWLVRGRAKESEELDD